MSSSANVRSIHALEGLRGALGRFSSEAREPLRAAEQEIRRTLEFLQERQGHWQREVQRRQQAVRQAHTAVQRCQASARRDPNTGRMHVPDCSAYQNALTQAQRQLREAEVELRTVRESSRLVQQAAADYQRQAQRLASQLSNGVPKATALLTQSITILQSYMAMGPVPTSSVVSNSISATGVLTAEPRIRFAQLDASANARYDKSTDTILINENYRDIDDPALLSPLMAHENVHVRHKSDEPRAGDEASLQKYVDEELEAYQAQHKAWLDAKDDFYQRYPTEKSRMPLGGGQDLLSDHLELEEQVKDMGWAGFRAWLVDKYRRQLGG